MKLIIFVEFPDPSQLSSGDAPAIDVKTVKWGETVVLECPVELKRPDKYEWIKRPGNMPESTKIFNVYYFYTKIY